MPGMPMGHGGAQAPPHLLPGWLGVAWAVVFLVIAGSHLRHMATTTGQRRPWHACHVLMALGMAFMYAPASIDPLALPAALWQVVFALGGLIAATWAVGGVGRVSTLIWLLTSIDLGAMLFMWAGSGGSDSDTATVAWLLGGYLVAEAMLWGLDLYRRLDGATPIVSWRQLAAESGVGMPAASVGGNAGGSATLLGELDINASMIAMTLGMAYMLVAMRLTG